jgi:hypothetical protein
MYCAVHVTTFRPCQVAGWKIEPGSFANDPGFTFALEPRLALSANVERISPIDDAAEREPKRDKRGEDRGVAEKKGVHDALTSS